MLGRMHLSPYLSDWVKQIQASSSAQAGEWEKDHTTFIKRLPVIVRDAWKIVSGVLIYILIGIGIGAFMHGFVPEGFFEQYMSKDNWFAVPLSVILAVPMYANAAGIVPVIEVFVAQLILHGEVFGDLVIRTDTRDPAGAAPAVIVAAPPTVVFVFLEVGEGGNVDIAH